MGRLLQIAALFVMVVRLAATDATPASYQLTAADHQLLEDLQRTAFQFFVEQSHPRTGLVRDRARADGSESAGKASIAASGFSLSGWVIAVERGWVQRDEALDVLRRKLRFLVEEAPRHHGFFYHFMEMATGERAWKCEVSSIDSALLYSGAIVAREYFADPELTTLVNRLLGDVDWEWFRGGGKLVSLSWHDETGFSRYRWDHFSEHLLMSFLALGTSKQPFEADYWYSWSRSPVGRYGDYVYLQEPPLFVYQFPQAYLDLRDRRDGSVDHFRNSQLATLAQRDFSLSLRDEFPSWGENLWGLTASDSATGYKAWGGPPRTKNYNALDGTVVPCAAAGSLTFAPRETLAVLHNMRASFGDRIWKRYGFVDAFNPESGWVNEDVIGIDLGISLVQAENLRTGLIHRLFMQAPEVRQAMQKAGFLSTRRDLNAEEQAQLRAAAASAWNRLQKQSASSGLHVSAWVAAQRLGLVEAEAARRAVAELIQAPVQGDPAQFAAALVGVRQGMPELATAAEARLGSLDWKSLAGAGGALGETERMGVFLQVARGLRSADAWQALSRETVARPPVHVLVPASDAGALLPGLWLDERAVLAGASASQLAWQGLYSATGAPASALTAALWLDNFPGETLERYGAVLAQGLAGDADGQAAFLMVAAGLLTDDSLRAEFQRDPLVQAGRAAIAEFAEAAFGPNTSLLAQRELAGPRNVPEQRRVKALAADTPRTAWDWHELAGLQFKDSVADFRAGDPPVSMRFAFTWDAQALYFHAEVVDSPTGYAVPAVRNRYAELFVDPDRDGLEWLSKTDYQFGFIQAHHWTKTAPGEAAEFFNGVKAKAVITPTEQGYLVEASIPWTSLSVTARRGLELGVSPAVIAEGTKEWEPVLKLNWSYYREDAKRVRLGVLTLE